MNSDLQILEAFNEFFEMVPADSDQLREEVYKLRYQVYCVETQFEDESAHPDEMEYDEFDNISLHYLIRHKNSKAFAATTRLILPNNEQPNFLFPIEIHSTIEDKSLLEGIPREQLCEASRFCVSKEFKKRRNEAGTTTGITNETLLEFTENERRTFPHLSIALVACSVRMCHEQNIPYWFAIMEPALFRFFAKIGIHFKTIGPAVNYHGKRQPGFIKISDLLADVYKVNKPVWHMLTLNGQYGINFK